MSSLNSYEEFMREFKQILSEGDNLLEGDECFFDLIANLDNPKSVLKFARSLKEEGNSFFKEGNFEEAMEKYGYAGLALVRYNFEMEEDRVESFDLSVCLLLNLTACLSKLKDYVHVGQLCSLILDYKPNNVKALFRRAKAASNLGEYEWAYWDLLLAFEIEPGNKEVCKELEEIKGNLCKNRMRKESKNEAPIGLGMALPSKKQKRNKEQANSNELSQDRGIVSVDKQCLKDCVPKEYVPKEVGDEESGEAMEDTSVLSPSSKTDSSECDIASEVLNIDGVSHIEGELEDSHSGKDSCVIDIPSNPIENRHSSPTEAKCRFHNRRRQGSLLTISKKDYLSMVKGKTIICGNARMGAYMQVRVVGQQSHNKSPTISESCVGEKVEQNYRQVDAIEEVCDNSDLMESASNLNSCVTKEENLPTWVETNSPSIVDSSSSSNVTMAPPFRFSANKAFNSRMKRRYPKYTYSAIPRTKESDAIFSGSPQLHVKSKRARTMFKDNSFPFSSTNNVCVCRNEVGRKRKHAHPSSMVFCLPPRKKLSTYSRCIGSVCCCYMSKDISYGEGKTCNSYEMAHSCSSRM